MARYKQVQTSFIGYQLARAQSPRMDWAWDLPTGTKLSVQRPPQRRPARLRRTQLCHALHAYIRSMASPLWPCLIPQPVTGCRPCSTYWEPKAKDRCVHAADGERREKQPTCDSDQGRKAPDRWERDSAGSACSRTNRCPSAAGNSSLQPAFADAREEPSATLGRLRASDTCNRFRPDWG